MFYVFQLCLFTLALEAPNIQVYWSYHISPRGSIHRSCCWLAPGAQPLLGVKVFLISLRGSIHVSKLALQASTCSVPICAHSSPSGCTATCARSFWHKTFHAVWTALCCVNSLMHPLREFTFGFWPGDLPELGQDESQTWQCGKKRIPTVGASLWD